MQKLGIKDIRELKEPCGVIIYVDYEEAVPGALSLELARTKSALQDR